jgi:hypothetical protein
LLAAALVLCGVVPAGFAPVAGAQGAPATAAASQQIVKTHFVVVRMLYQSLQVRSAVDMRELHTFTYSPAIREKMQNIYNAGGFQYGDNVVVSYRHGDDVAVKIKGKPSKAK